jgi:hypothetical protein
MSFFEVRTFTLGAEWTSLPAAADPSSEVVAHA